jgi:predicted transcriptional regulator
MTSITVPLSSDVEQALSELVEITGANRSAVIRKAIEKYREEQAILEILVAQQEVAEGKILRGSIDDLLKD